MFDCIDTQMMQTALELDDYFAGKGFNFSIPLDMAYGTAFQQQVWKCLREIPVGGTTTYGAISQRLGNPKPLPHSLAVSAHFIVDPSGQPNDLDRFLDFLCGNGR